MSGTTTRTRLEPVTLGGRMAEWLIGVADKATGRWGHRGYWHVVRLVGRLAASEQDCIVELSTGGYFRFGLRDPYWARLVSAGYTYEPEIWFVLSHFRDRVDCVFLDCGANYGYWSAAVTGPAFGWRKAIAVEASPSTYRRLLQNRDLNDGRFDALNLAVHSVSGRLASIHDAGVNHADAVISLGDGGAPHVETVSVDDLLARCLPGSVTSVVLKLDVEGAEVEALRGASGLLRGDALIIYEDHGKDPNSAVTDYVVSNLDVSVYFVDDRQRVLSVTSAADAGRLKSNARRGYNFFAAVRRSSFDDRLKALAHQAGS